MLASISPLGERARGQRWLVTVGCYLAASALGGATTGAVVGGLGSAADRLSAPSGSMVAAIALACAVVAVALDLGVGGVRVPTVRRQVDEDWLARYRGWVYGSGFGYQLGLGLATIVTSSSVYMTFTLAFLTGSVARGTAIGATFGIARAVPLLTIAAAERPAQLRAVHRRMQAGAQRGRQVTIVSMAAAGVAAGIATARELSWLA